MGAQAVSSGAATTEGWQVKILAIDPGREVSHWVVYDHDEKRVVAVGPNHSNDDLLAALRYPGIDPDEWNGVTHIVIETIEPRGERLGHDVVNTILWVGRFQEASRGELLGRSKVWKFLCGKDRDDAAVRRVLIDKLGPPKIFTEIAGPKGGVKRVSAPGPTFGVSGHCWQSLGLAVTFAETISNNNEGGTHE
jgi:hypothetical protein